jgi:LPLT family lysophospholipid transporter-like MFS transporter
VPLNALLQKQGHETIGAGRALAVQNLFENIAILLFVGFYAGMEKSGVAVVPTVAILGGLLFTGLAALSVWRLKAGRR